MTPISVTPLWGLHGDALKSLLSVRMFFHLTLFTYVRRAAPYLAKMVVSTVL